MTVRCHGNGEEKSCAFAIYDILASGVGIYLFFDKDMGGTLKMKK